MWGKLTGSFLGNPDDSAEAVSTCICIVIDLHGMDKTKIWVEKKKIIQHKTMTTIPS